MSSERYKQKFYVILLFASVCGFEIAAGLTSMIDILSTPVSIGVRVFVAGMSIIAIFMDFSINIKDRRVFIIGFVIFWCIYCIRIMYSTLISDEYLLFPAWYYYAWALGACALPMLGLSLWAPRGEDADRNFIALFAALAFAGLLAAVGASPQELNQSDQYVATGRLQLIALNPILLGQLGATMAILSAWALVRRYHRYGWAGKSLFLAALLTGGGLLIGSNSRGPLVSATVCLVFISMGASKRGRLYGLLLMLVAVVVFVPATQYLEEEYQISTYTRLFGQSQLTEENTLDRLSRYSGAMKAFIHNPLFGSSLEEPTHGGYPHNLLIEALMATGVMGGVLLLFLMAQTTVWAAKIYVAVPGYGWATLLFFQYFVASQFSGAIYTMNYLWISAGVVVAIYATLVPAPRRRVSRC